MSKEKVKNQIITDRYAFYQGDCITIMKEIPSESIGMSIFSPPFANLYSYSDETADMSNSDYGNFFKHFQFLVEELLRVLIPGRIVAVHCMDLPTHKQSGEEIGLRDFPGDLIRCFQASGFIFHSRHCIWKDPLIAAVRTHALGLAHKQIVKDSAMCRTGIADYLLAFRKPGDNPIPISHPNGLIDYQGERLVPKELDRFIIANNCITQDQAKNKRSHWIWQQYASPVWFDIRQTKILSFREAKDEDDEKHIAPLQLDVVERCVALWSTKRDIVLSPFAGIGTEVYVAVKNGRKAIGIELKKRYYHQAVKNLWMLCKNKRSALG